MIPPIQHVDPPGRIVRPADFERVLGTPIRLRSAHFAIHHLAGRPLPVGRCLPARDPAACAPDNASLSTELSTERPIVSAPLVDDLRGAAIAGRALARWLGLVVPKRHARRAVTRTLIKRQIRQTVRDCAAQLEPGLWVVRQRSAFEPTKFPSAASEALKLAVRAELRALLARAARGERDSQRSSTPRRLEAANPPASSRKSRGGGSASPSAGGAPSSVTPSTSGPPPSTSDTPAPSSRVPGSDPGPDTGSHE